MPTGQLRDVEKAFIYAVAFELGILPIESSSLNMDAALKQLSPEESRKIRRKFRKLWRKTMRERLTNVVGPLCDSKKEMIKKSLGVGKHNLSRFESNARKTMVLEALWNNVIGPMVERFDNPDMDRTLTNKEGKLE